jgi:hypothetical protein
MRRVLLSGTRTRSTPVLRMLYVLSESYAEMP